MIVPTSTGQVFISDEASIKSDNLPTHKLDDDHIFIPFMKSFWNKITTPGVCDPLMDAYAMLLFDIETVPDACRQYVCDQLRETPPDIVVIDSLNPESLLHGFHQRTSKVWPYINVAKATVDKWEHGMVHSPDTHQTLAVEALLKMIIVHGTGHWHYTLARSLS